MNVGRIPKSWKNLRIVPVYKSKRDKNEWANYRRVSLVGIKEKVYGSILIEK